MFESTAVDSKRRTWRGVFWGMLPASLAAHAMVAFGIVGVQTWEVTFPIAPPPMIEGYRLMVALPLPPPPDTVVIARGERLPLKPLSMSYPIYPDKWRYRRVEDTLVLK